ncbi:MAG: methylated-DNA--[protein]-cysteine S-methyltransferase [Pseudomonadota bacterium]
MAAPLPSREPSRPTAEKMYPTIAAAIDYLVAQRSDHPSLDDVARVAGLTPHHFQRTFKEAVGVSPKRFLQHFIAADARKALIDGASVLDAALMTGHSGPSRLHDLFIVSEAMTPGAFKSKGEGTIVRYGQVAGPLGTMLVGATDKGICWLSFIGDDEGRSQSEMRSDWPAAEFVQDQSAIEPYAKRISSIAKGTVAAADKPLKLHVCGTNFQLKVWEALLRIPDGNLATYGQIATAIRQPTASRAVGSAVGANSISLLIPCHRVIRAAGAGQNYRWGAARKHALISMELSTAELANAS